MSEIEDAKEKLEKNFEFMLDDIAKKGVRKKAYKLVKYLLGTGFMGVVAYSIIWYLFK